MLLRADPYMPVAPLAQFPQFLYFRMAVLDVVLLGQTSRVEDSDITAKAEKNARGFVGQQTGI